MKTIAKLFVFAATFAAVFVFNSARAFVEDGKPVDQAATQA